MKIKNLNNKFYMTLILSYLVLLITPIIFMAILQNEAQRSAKNNTLKYNTVLLNQVETTMDSYNRELKLLSLQFNSNLSIQNILASQKNFEEITLSDTSNIMKDLRECKANISFVSDIFIYLGDTDMIITPNNYISSKQFFNNGYLRFNDYDYETWKNTYLTGLHHNKYFPPTSVSPNTSSQQIMLYVQSLPISASSNINMQLIVEIDPEKILSLLTQISEVNNGEVLVLGTEREVLFTTMPKVSDTYLNLTTYIDSDTVTYLKDSKEYAISSSSNTLLWKYTLIIPEKEYLSEKSHFHFLFLILIIICIIIGYIEIKFFLKLNYSPLSALIQEIRNKNSDNSSKFGDEFDFIKNEFETIQQNKSQLENMYNKTLPTLKNSVLSSLFNGQITSEEKAREMLAYAHISFTESGVGVITVSLDNFGTFIKEDSPNEWSLARLATSNILNELIQEEYPCVLAELWQRKISAIVNINPKNKEEYYRKIKNISKNLCDFIHENFDGDISIGISCIREKFSMISECYNESLVALDTKTDGSNGQISFYGDLNLNDNDFYYYPSEVETKLLSVISCYDYPVVCNIIDEVISINLNNIKLTPELRKCLGYDLYTSYMHILSRLASTDNNILRFKPKDQTNLLENGTLNEIVSDIKDRYKELCGYLQKTLPSPKDKSIISIEEYINENYSNNMLSVSTLSEVFGMSRQSLFTLFKQQKGVTPSDYISSVRVEKSIELLKDKSLNISQIAAMVGWGSEDTYIRLFKKHMGVTPGKFRDSL